MEIYYTLAILATIALVFAFTVKTEDTHSN